MTHLPGTPEPTYTPSEVAAFNKPAQPMPPSKCVMPGLSAAAAIAQMDFMRTNNARKLVAPARKAAATQRTRTP